MDTKISFSLISHRKVLEASSTTVHVLCKIQSHAPETEGRHPINLIVVLDRSGSMSGSKLQAAILTLHALVKELGPQDRLGLVSFESEVKTEFEPMAMTESGQRQVSAVLNTIVSGGSTRMTEALGLSLALTRAHDSEADWHLILLSDGLPDAGAKVALSRFAEEHQAHPKVTMSCFGYGQDVDPRLLGGLADVAKGAYHFVPGNEPPVEAFAAELGRLRSVVGLEPTIVLSTAIGVTIAGIPAFAKSKMDAHGNLRIELPALTSGESRSLVLGVIMDRSVLVEGRKEAILRGDLSYRSIENGLLQVNEASFVPVVAGKKGEYNTEVIHDLVLQGIAELMGICASQDEQKRQSSLLSLVNLAADAGLERDPQIADAVLLANKIFDAISRSQAAGAAEAGAAARGVYNRSVTTGEPSSLSRVSTQTYAMRLKGTMLMMNAPPNAAPSRTYDENPSQVPARPELGSIPPIVVSPQQPAPVAPPELKQESKEEDSYAMFLLKMARKTFGMN